MLHRLSAAVVVWITALAGCAPSPPPSDPNAIRVGAVLPFTGDLAASGINLERALRFAAEQINQAGGVAGRPIELIARDSHSAVIGALGAAQKLIAEDGVFAMIGPESDDQAKFLIPISEEKGIVLIAPTITSNTVVSLNDSYSFRLSPSALVLGKALAKHMIDDGISHAAVVHVRDEYGTALAAVVEQQLQQQGCQVDTTFGFDPLQTISPTDVLTILSGNPEGIVLITYPDSGATLVQQIVSATPIRWYLPPVLKTNVFPQNVPPGRLEGAVGIAPAVVGDRAGFSTAFSTRWNGDLPLDAACYYYDAMALLGLAAATAAQQAGGVMAPNLAIAAALRLVSASSGQEVGWSQVGLGLSLAGQGDALRYSGVSGPLPIDATNSVPGGSVRYWSVHNDQVVDESLVTF